MNTSSLFGIDLRIKSLLKKNEKKRLTAVCPDNVKLEIIKNYYDLNNHQSLQGSERYIQLFDCYGEMSLKYNFYLSPRT